MLNRQFKRLNPETSILQVKDALTFSLAKVLLNHLVYLRHPQRNFKSTENSYHLDLLDDVSDMIRNYYDALYEQVDQHYLQKLAYGNGSIFMKLYEPREHLAKLDRVIKQGNADLDVVKNTLLDLYATISGQKEYILFHSRYPDNLTTFDVYSQRLYHNLGARGMHRSEVIKNMIHYNLLVTSLKENFSDNQAINELRIFTNVGYESIDELNKETTSIVRQFQESEIPEHHVQVTHEKFLQQQKGNWVILAGTAIAPPLDYSFLERYPSESKGTSESQALSVTSQSDKYGYSVHQGADVVEIDGVSQPIEIISKAINLAPDLKSSLTLLQDELNKAYKKELEKSNPSKILLQRYVDISNNSEQLVHKLNDKTLTMEGKINAIHVFVTNSKSQTSIAKNVAKAILIVAITAAVLTTALVVAGILALAGTAAGPAGTLTGGVLGFLKGALIGWSATKIAAASAVGTVTCAFSSYKLFTPQNIDAHVDKVANAAHAHV